MLGQTITLNDLIQTANKKVGAEAEALSKLADQDGLGGQLEEILDYVESNEALFCDKNLTDVKSALSKFMGKLPPQKLKLTLAAMKREMEEFKAQKQQPGKENGGSILNQSDLDALLAEAQSSHTPPRKSKLASALPKRAPEAEKKGNGANGSSMLDQSDIDMLFSKDGTPESDQGQSMDQSLIDSLFSKEPEAVAEPVEDGTPESDQGQSMDQSLIDSLFSEEPKAAAEPVEELEQKPVDSMEATDGETAGAEQTDDADDVTEAGQAETVDQNFVDSLLSHGNEDEPAESPADESDVPSEVEMEAAAVEPEKSEEPEESATASQPDEEAPAAEEIAESSPETEPAEESAPLAADSVAGAAPPDVTEEAQDTPSAPEPETNADRVEAAVPPPAAPASPKNVETGDGAFVAASTSRVLEERGTATVIKEFYRVYVRENGSFRIIFESKQKEQAQMELLKTVQDFPARQVSLGKVVQKEVMVIKEDTNDIPFSLKIDFSE